MRVSKVKQHDRYATTVWMVKIKQHKHHYRYAIKIPKLMCLKKHRNVVKCQHNYVSQNNYRSPCECFMIATIQTTPTWHKTRLHGFICERQTIQTQLPKRKRQNVIVFYERFKMIAQLPCPSTVWIVNVKQLKHHHQTAEEIPKLLFCFMNVSEFKQNDRYARQLP